MNPRDTFTLLFGRERSATISLRLVAERIWNNRKFIIKWECVGIVFGLIVCISIPKEYVSTVKMVPENKSTQIFNFIANSTLQSIFNKERDAFSYRLYPLILDSKPFLYNLLSVPVSMSDNVNYETFTIRELLGSEYKYPWLQDIIELIHDSDKENGSLHDLTRTDYRLMERLRNNISLFVMEKTGHLELQVKMQDPMAAAVLADTIAVRLERFVADYRNLKDMHRYEFVNDMFEESKAQYEEYNLKYAQYLDSNHNLSKNVDKIEMSRLKINKDIYREGYHLNSVNLLSEKFKHALYSPVYFIIEPSTVAVKSSYPRKLVILSYCMFFFGYIPLLKSVFKRA